jgi:chromosome partitioning protein
MGLMDVFNFIKEMIERGAGFIAAFTIGVLVIGFGLWWLGFLKWPWRGRDKNTESHSADLLEHKTRIVELEKSLHSSQEITAFVRTELHESKTRLKEAEEAARDCASEANERASLAEQRVRAAQKKIALLVRQLDSEREKIQGLSQACEQLKEDNAGLATSLAGAEEHGRDLQLRHDEAILLAAAYKSQIDELTKQIRRVDDLQGKLWEKPVGSSVPTFRTLVPGKPPIIAVANLKGGVGKTSLTANIAATVAAKGKRVLVVDLDYQGSLTQLCLPYQRVQEMTHKGSYFVQEILRATAEHASVAWRNCVAVDHRAQGSIRILATNDDLTDVEEHVKARWLLNPESMDVRFLLRTALHDPQIQDRFDVVLLDCPPRLSTACINALACSDWVLIPVLLDRISTEAVPRLLEWLRHLKARSLCPHLNVLGVVANRTQQKTKLSVKENGVWEELQPRAANNWGAPVYHFERFIPSSQVIADAASQSTFAAHHSALEPLFFELTEEIQGRLYQHESSRPTAIH